MRSLLLLLILSQVSCAQNSTRPSPLSKLETDIQSIRQVQADYNAELSSIRGELGQLRGKVEELEHYQSESVSRDVGSLKKELASLRMRVPPPALIPVKELEEDEIFGTTLQPDIASYFDRGLSSLRIGDYGGTLDSLGRALEQSNGEPWSGTAVFWIAVAHDGLGELRDALNSYNEFVSGYPKHPRAPLALFKQAAVFIKLGDTKVAKLTLQKLITQYPKSIWAAEAKKKMKDL